MFDFLNTTYYGNTIVQWSIAIGLILLSVVLGRTLYWILGRWVKYLTRKTETKLDDIIIDMIEEPLVLILILVGVRFSLNTLNLTGWLAEFVGKGFNFVIPVIAAWLVVRVYNAIHEEYLIPLTAKTETDLDDQLLPIIKKGVMIGVLALGVVIGLNNAGYNVAAILAGLGIGGLAFALAAQDTVSNFFGGITIFLQKPFAIGDRIEVVGIDGWVTEIGIRSSTVTNFYGQKNVIPNRMIVDNPVKNIDTQTAYWVKMNLHFRHDTSAEKIELAMKLLDEIVAGNELLLANGYSSAKSRTFTANGEKTKKRETIAELTFLTLHFHHLRKGWLAIENIGIG